MSASTDIIQQRFAVIERMARAIAFQRGKTWERMTAARQAQIRTEVRVALKAMKPPSVESDIDISWRAKLRGGPMHAHADFSASGLLEDWIDEVLA